MLLVCSLSWLMLRPQEELHLPRLPLGQDYSSLPVPDRDEVLRQLRWEWECLGPDEQPRDLNPGGRAIPAYAAGRGNGTGRINFLYVHPRHPGQVWACSPTGGLWRTLDNGETWSPGGTDQLPISGVSSVAVDRRRTHQWVVGTGDGDDVFMYTDGVWITRDGGESYEHLNGGVSGFELPFGRPGDFDARISHVVSLTPRLRRLAVASNRGLFVSSGPLRPDRVSWKKAYAGVFYDLVRIPGRTRKRDILAAAGDRLVISFNGGHTWEQMPSPEYPRSDRFPFLRINLEYSPDDPGRIYAAVTCSVSPSQSEIGEATLQVFDLQTRTWTLVRSLREDMNNVIPTRARAFAISPADRKLLMCGNVQPLYRSVDGGKTFARIEKNQMHDDCHHIAFAPDGKTVWAAHDGGVSVSFDAGIRFIARDRGIGVANVFGVSTGQTTGPSLAFGAYDTGGNVLRDGRWWHVSWGDGFETITHPADPRIQFVTMQNGGIHRSRGEDFDENVSASGARTEWHTWIRMHPSNHSTIYCAGARLMRSPDLGDHWETLFDVKSFGDELINAYRFFLSEAHPGVMYVYVLDKEVTRPRIFRTFNLTEGDPQRVRWEEVPRVPFEGWIMQMAVDPEDPARFWVLSNRAEATGKIWYYDGSQYRDETANMGNCFAESMVLQRGKERRLYVGSNYGVFTRREGEAQWTLLTGLPGTFIRSLDINYTAGKLVVGTFGRGIWWGDLVRK